MTKTNYNGSYSKFTIQVLNNIIKKFKKIFKNAESVGGIEKAFKIEKYTNKEIYWEEIGRYFIEIQSSLDRQKFYPMFLKSFSKSYENQGFGRVEQFINHIENYLTEVYILNQRLMKLLGIIKRESRKVNQWDINKDINDSLKTDINSKMSSMLSVRVAHIHDVRFSDMELNKLSTIEFILKNSEDEEEKRMYIGYRKILLTLLRHKWKKQIKNNTDEIEKMLDYIFYYLKKSKILNEISKKIQN